MRYQIRPLGHWRDPVTVDRRSPYTFRASWQATLDLLGYETEQLGATLVVLQVDVTEGEIRRRDGMLRANARVGHPGVVVSFESDHGPLRYATDTYDGWQANVRAIALALHALRAVDRYGVTRRGEQYIGWRAIAAPAGFRSAEEAVRWMRERAAGRPFMRDLRDATPQELYRHLARRYHPDVGGDPTDWERLDQAKQIIDREEETHGQARP